MIDALPPSLMKTWQNYARGCASSQALTKAEKLLEKRTLERDFRRFIEYVFAEYYGNKWIHNWHHDEIINLLLAIERREIPNAVVNLPPRYGKTEIIVILWQCWTFIRNPKAAFMHGSYSDELALKNSAQIRDILKSPCIQKHWPLKMRDSEDSKGLWKTEQGGGLKAGAAGGPMTGFGAGITSWQEGDLFDGAIILDDPLKPDDANSEAMRNQVNERLSGTLHSRRNHSKVPMVIVMQRLHVNDPSGIALSGGVMGDTFHHLKLPALSDRGPLWPFKHTQEQLETMQEKNRVVFAGQYQQEPYVAGGEVYQLGWFARWAQLPVPPTRKMIIHSWDTAYKAGTHNDPSCCTVWHVTPSLYYLAEVYHGKWEYPELKKRVRELGIDQKPDAILIEDKASGQSLIQELRSDTALPIIAIEPEGDKETRARTTAFQVEAGRIALPFNAPWLLDYENELTAFPKGAHDDRVDSTSQFLRWMRDNGGIDMEFQDMMDRLYAR